MGAGCSSEKATATTKGPPAEPQAKLVATDEAPAKASESPWPARIEITSTAGTAPVVRVVEEDDGKTEEAHSRDPELRMEALTRCFEALDKDKSGNLDIRELKQYLFKTGVNVAHISGKAEELMSKLDMNADELVSKEEFVQMMDALLSDKSDEDLEVWVAEVVFTATSRNVVGFGNSLGEVLSNLQFNQQQVEKIRDVFQTLDRDNSRFVELDEVKVLFGKSGVDMESASEEVTAIMSKLDKNGDGKISEQEFLITMSAVRKCLGTDQEFLALLHNVEEVAKAPETAAEKPALTDVLLAEDI